MQRVQGFGGFFFRAKDPEGLAKWYHDHLGINPAPKNMEMPPWVTESGVTVFGPFAADTDYFAADKTFMLNFRVADLDAMIAQLKSADIEVSHESEMEGIGRFARIHDPEGNAIELWEPAAQSGRNRDQGRAARRLDDVAPAARDQGFQIVRVPQFRMSGSSRSRRLPEGGRSSHERNTSGPARSL